MALQKVKKTGFTSTTSKEYVINAPAVYLNLIHAEEDGWQGEPVGATSGGVTVTVENEYREIEVDGVFTSHVGGKVLVRSTMRLVANIKSITARTIQLALNGVTTVGDGVNAPTGSTIVEGKGRIEDSDYLTNVGIVGDYSGSNEPIIIILDNALSIEGLDMAMEDDDEAVIEITWEAHADADQVADRKLPGRIIFPAKD